MAIDSKSSMGLYPVTMKVLEFFNAVWRALAAKKLFSDSIAVAGRRGFVRIGTGQIQSDGESRMNSDVPVDRMSRDVGPSG